MKKLFLVILVTVLAGCDQSSPAVETSANTVKPAVDEEPVGRILQWGVYTLLRGGEPVDSPVTSTGKALSKPVITRDRETDRIPLIKDKYMAYQYRLSNLPGRAVELRRVLKHPAFQLPDGTTTTGSDYVITKKLDRGEVFAYDAYALNEDYEMVEGEWVFQLWYQDKMLVEQKFTTYWPDGKDSG